MSSRKKAVPQAAPAPADAAFDYTAALQELGMLLQRLQDDATPLEEGFRLFQQGHVLLQQCRSYLDQTELEVKQIISQADGSLQATDFA
jgi:exodeoxyribonuclease VII small subunit